MARIDNSHGLNERWVTWEDDVEVVMQAVRAAGRDDIAEALQAVEMIDCEWNEIEEGMIRFLLTTSKDLPWVLDAWRVQSPNSDVQEVGEDVREAFRMLDRWMADEERRTGVHCPGLRRSIARVRTMARIFLDAIHAAKRFRTEIELALQGKRSERYYDAEIEWLVAIGDVERTGMGLQIRAASAILTDTQNVTAWGVDIGDSAHVQGMRGPTIKDPKRKPRLVADNSPPSKGATLFPSRDAPAAIPKIEPDRPCSDAPSGSRPSGGRAGPEPADHPVDNDALQRVFGTLSYDPDITTPAEVDEILRQDLGSLRDPLYESVKPEPARDGDEEV